MMHNWHIQKKYIIFQCNYPWHQYICDICQKATWFQLNRISEACCRDMTRWCAWAHHCHKILDHERLLQMTKWSCWVSGLVSNAPSYILAGASPQTPLESLQVFKPSWPGYNLHTEVVYPSRDGPTRARSDKCWSAARHVGFCCALGANTVGRNLVSLSFRPVVPPDDSTRPSCVQQAPINIRVSLNAFVWWRHWYALRQAGYTHF